MSVEKNYEMTKKMIIGEGLEYDLNCYQTKRNNNVVVIGGAGTGKTRGIVEPNILQATGSYVISDPKGNLYQKYKRFLEVNGYEVKKIDFVHPEQSVKYNLFEGTEDPYNPNKSNANIVNLANTIVSIRHDGSRHMDPFWDEAATLLLTALIAALLRFCSKQDHSFSAIEKMVSMMLVDEDAVDLKTDLDLLFDQFEEQDAEAFAIKKYKAFRVAAARTLKSIQISLNALISNYANEYMDMMMMGHELDVTMIGRRKTALFICASDTERTYDGLVNVIFTQIMNGLVSFADTRPNSRLPIPVRFIMDDFATNVRITDFPRMISSIRSRGISTMIILQSEAQLMQYYEKDAQTILSNCDTYVYLGGNDIDTAKSVAERADKSLHTVLEMPVGCEWVFRRGEKPVFTRTIDLEEYQKTISRWQDLKTERRPRDYRKDMNGIAPKYGFSKEKTG